MLHLRLEIVLNVLLRLLNMLAKIDVLAHATQLLNLLNIFIFLLNLLFASVVAVVSGDHRMHALIDSILLISFTFEAIEHLFNRITATEAFLVLLLSCILLCGLYLVRKHALSWGNVLRSNMRLLRGFICTGIVAIQLLRHQPLIRDIKPTAVPSLF